MAARNPHPIEDRRAAIVRALVNDGSCAIDDLAERFDVSRMTVHRDLDVLEGRGLVSKTRGWASAESSLLFQSNFHYRVHQNADIKQALARTAASFVEPGMAIMIDDSTTTLPIATLVRDVRPLTIITYSLAVLEALADDDGPEVILAGGTYKRAFRAFQGRACEVALGMFRADMAFMSAPGLSGRKLYHQNEDTVPLKRAMLGAVGRSVLLLDATKIGKGALNFMADFAEFDDVICDQQAYPHLAPLVGEADIRFHRV